MSEHLLAPLFAIAAFFYAMIGFGGSSAYNSLLALNGVEYNLIPVIALSCNIIVVSGGLVHFVRAGHFSFQAVAPFALVSVPMAFIGGRLVVSESAFITILAICLLVSGALMLKSRPAFRASVVTPLQRWLIGLPVGALLGLIAGITGIGGGVILAPTMYLTAWADDRTVASSTSFFILVNSLSGLIAHLSRADTTLISSQYLPFLALPVAVLIGGQLGSYLSAGVVSRSLVRSLTAILILYVGIRLLVIEVL